MLSNPLSLYRKIKKLMFPRQDRLQQKGKEQESEFYDQMFLQGDHWKEHYTASRYYPTWAIIADRISRVSTRAVLDIGCGPGQFAAFLKDKGIHNYVGVDFSPERIKQAKTICPDFTFIQADIFEADIFDVYDYDAVVCCEFLEHVEKDIEVLMRIRSGVRFFGTVPNFPGIQHVRHFNDPSEVRDRYGKQFKDLHVDTHLANDSGKTFYIIEGTTI